jgi:hypothetical protein
MKVYLGDDNGMRLVGRAEVPEDCGMVYEVPMSGDAAAAAERFIIAAVPRPARGDGAPALERAVLAWPGQLVELLPGWQPLAS